MVNICIID